MDEGSSLFVTFFLPPVIGAIIGYVTNAVAIRMLFRPFKEWRVLGIRVPFTPGIIPRQRGMIARSIGHMVARELLNEKVLRRRLVSVKITRGFKNAISGFTGHILETPVGPGLRGRYAEFADTLYESLKAGLAGFIASGDFADLITNHIGELGNRLLSLSAADLLLRMEEDGGSGDFIGKLLSGPIPSRVLDALEAEFLDRARNGNTLASIVPLPPREKIESLVDRLYGPVFLRFSAILKTVEVKKEIVLRGRLFLREILAELSFFQRLVLNAGQYGRVLEERMPEIADGFIRAVEEAGKEGLTRKRIAAAAAGEIRRIVELPLPGFFGLLGVEAEEASGRLKELAKESIANPDFHERVRRGIAAFLEKRRDMTVKDLLAGEFGLSGEDLVRTSADFVVSRVRQTGPDEFSRIFTFLADFLFPAVAGKPLGELLSITRERKERLDIFISERLFALIARKLPEILKSFEVEDLIVERINELDVEEVEDLLLSVISRHLAWINLFGGILGALIGFSQVVLQIVRSR
jgi:uncharacterized membrane protein YheB (UPF0754 family)